MSRYIFLSDVLDNVPIEAKVDAYLDAQKWPGYPSIPANPYPIVVKDIDKYVTSPKPVHQPGGRVYRKNQKYAFLSDYNTYP